MSNFYVKIFILLFCIGCKKISSDSTEVAGATISSRQNVCIYYDTDTGIVHKIFPSDNRTTCIRSGVATQTLGKIFLFKRMLHQHPVGQKLEIPTPLYLGITWDTSEPRDLRVEKINPKGPAGRVKVNGQLFRLSGFDPATGKKGDVVTAIHFISANQPRPSQPINAWPFRLLTGQSRIANEFELLAYLYNAFEYVGRDGLEFYIKVKDSNGPAGAETIALITPQVYLSPY